MQTTEYTEYTEIQRVGSVSVHTRKMICTDNIIASFSVYFVYSVVRRLPF